MQQQPPVVDYSASNLDAASKKLQILQLWMRHTHVQPGSTGRLNNQHSFEMSVTNLLSDKIWNLVTISHSVLELWCWITARKDETPVDLWPSGFKMSSFHFILLDISENLCHNWHMNYWIMARDVICEATVTFDDQNLLSSSPNGRLCTIWRSSLKVFELSHENETYRQTTWTHDVSIHSHHPHRGGNILFHHFYCRVPTFQKNNSISNMRGKS